MSAPEAGRAQAGDGDVGAGVQRAHQDRRGRPEQLWPEEDQTANL